MSHSTPGTHRKAADVEDSRAPLWLQGLLVGLPSLEHSLEEGQGGAKARGGEDVLEVAAEHALPWLADGALLAQAIPGHDPQVAIDHVQTDGERVQNGAAQAARDRGLGAGRSRERPRGG